MDKKTQKRRRFRITRRFYAVVIGLVMVFVGFTFWRQEVELNKLRDKQADLQSQQTDNDLEKDKLTHMLEAAGSDEYIESIAREKLGWVKEGETRYIQNQNDQE